MGSGCCHGTENSEWKSRRGRAVACASPPPKGKLPCAPFTMTPPGMTRVHQVGARAAGLAGVRVVEATVPRELVARVARLLLLLRLLTRYRLDEMRGYGMPRAVITHRVDVRRYAAQKRAALAAHRTQVSGRGRGARLLRALLRSPLPAFRLACGTEWFAEPGGRTGELVA